MSLACTSSRGRSMRRAVEVADRQPSVSDLVNLQAWQRHDPILGLQVIGNIGCAFRCDHLQRFGRALSAIFDPHLFNRLGLVDGRRADIFDSKAFWSQGPEQLVEIVALSLVPQPLIVPDRPFQIQRHWLAHIHRLLSSRVIRLATSFDRTVKAAPVIGKGRTFLIMLRRSS